jgi:hypothetical protein
MSRLPLIALALALAISTIGPSQAAGANPFDQFVAPPPTGDVDDWVVPDEKREEKGAYVIPTGVVPVPPRAAGYWRPEGGVPTQAEADWYWIITAAQSWESAVTDVLSVCTRETMPYCICLANQLPKRMSSAEYTKLRADLASMGNRGMGHHETVPLAAAALQESRLCVQKTGVSP